MSAGLLVALVYDIILYGALAATALPIAFFLLWIFFDFWKKYILLFYVTVVVLFAGTVAAFYFTNHYWIYWYYPFPWWVQIIGLLFMIFSYLIVKLAQTSITTLVRFFYPLLKGQPIHLHVRGFYKYVRHPMYAVFPWAILGAFLYTGQLILLPVFLFNLLARNWYAAKEESHLKKVVIGDYEKYMKQTPNRFYPTGRHG